VNDAAAMLEADGLRVVFFKQGDRYAHRVEWFDDVRGAWTVAVESLEGTPDDPWPPSPPLQQLHIEERPTGRVILLVGMAGRTHWSAAVEVAVDRKTVTFDVAARLQCPPRQLRSTYRRSIEARAVHLRSESKTENDPLYVAPDAAVRIPGTIAWKYEFLRGVEHP
jgi:hypothetical protein